MVYGSEGGVRAESNPLRTWIDTPHGLTWSSEEDAGGAPGRACLQSPELLRGRRGSRGCSEGLGAARVEGKENFSRLHHESSCLVLGVFPE